MNQHAAPLLNHARRQRQYKGHMYVVSENGNPGALN
jgi:hypothetical protein